MRGWGVTLLTDQPRLFSSENFDVYFFDRGGNTIVIAFSPVDHPPQSGAWGSASLIKTGYSSIGIVAKQNDWYANFSDECVSLIRSLIERFDHVVCYGFSMGGYAAIKFSGMLRATTIIAMSPQFSVHPSDLDGKTPWYTKYARLFPNAGEAIRASDISGDLIAVYDPMFDGDKLAVDKISTIYDTTQIRLWFSGHGTVYTIRCSWKLRDIIELAIAQEWDDLRATMATARRAGPRRLACVIDAAFKANRASSIKLIEGYWPKLDEVWRKELMARHASISKFLNSSALSLLVFAGAL